MCNQQSHRFVPSIICIWHLIVECSTMINILIKILRAYRASNPNITSSPLYPNIYVVSIVFDIQGMPQNHLVHLLHLACVPITHLACLTCLEHAPSCYMHPLTSLAHYDIHTSLLSMIVHLDPFLSFHLSSYVFAFPLDWWDLITNWLSKLRWRNSIQSSIFNSESD